MLLLLTHSQQVTWYCPWPATRTVNISQSVCDHHAQHQSIVACSSSAVSIFKILHRIEKLVTILFGLRPIQLFEIFEYLFKSNIGLYKEGTVSQ